MNIIRINEELNNILNDRSEFDIIKDYYSIKNLSASFIEMIAIKNDIDEKERKSFIEDMLGKICIKGMYLNDIESKFKERYNSENNYQSKNDRSNTLKFFEKRTIKVNVNGIDYELEVYDTGAEYILVEQMMLTDDMLKAINKLNKERRIDRISNIIEQGAYGIYLDEETKKLVEKKLQDRKNTINQNFSPLKLDTKVSKDNFEKYFNGQSETEEYTQIKK